MTATFVTFYSFKGGVGRTQALANVAVALANRGQRVIVVDMDLESPGLPAFFAAESGDPLEPQAGVLEFLEQSFALPSEPPQATSMLIPCTHARRTPSAGSLRLLGAGDLSHDYEKRFSVFSWDVFYRERDGYRFMELFRQQLGEADADFVLVDSRTGLNDTGHICTFQLPDVIVALFALHSQGIEGTRRLAEAVQRYQQEEGVQGRPRRLLLVPARIDEAAPDELRERWLAEARRAFDGAHELLADLHDRIPYAAQIAFGEQIAVGGAQSFLSDSYERLVDRIVGRPDEEAVAPLHEIRSWLYELAEELYRASGERPSPPLDSLRDLRRWLAAESDRRDSILGRIDRARRALDRLRGGGGPDTIVIGPTTRLDRAEEMSAEADHLAAVVQAIDEWIASQQEQVRLRLVAAAEGDEQAVASKLPALYEALRAGQRLEVERQVSGLAEDLARDNVPALLRLGRLSLERLRQRHPSPIECSAWIEKTLESTITEPSNIDTRPVLKNLLALARADGAPPTLFQWMAYELICGDLAEDQSFTGVGEPIWRAEWSRLLAKPTDSHVDMDYPVGLDGRNQIERLAQGDAAMLQPIAVDIRQGLVALWQAGPRARAHLTEVFRRRNADPLLREGIKLLTQDEVVPVVRSGILAAWLEACDRPEEERSAVRGLLGALVEHGHVGEAFYALAALSLRNPALGAEPELAFVWAALLARAVQRDDDAWYRRLVTNSDAVLAILTSRAGRALLAAIAAGRTSAPPDIARIARSKLLYPAPSVEPLPSATREWLLALERDPNRDRTRAASVAVAEKQIEAIRARKVYAAWGPSASWESEFRELADREFREVLAATSAGHATARIQGLDVEKWIGRTHERLRQRHSSSSMPDGGALKAIERNFGDLKKVLGEFAEHVPRNGRSLRDEAHSFTQENSAIDALADWLVASPIGDPFEARLTSDVRDQLAGARA